MLRNKIIEKQDEIIANLKEVGQLYFRIKDKATKQDVARMASLTIKGRTLESELIILKAQDISVETTIDQEVERRIAETIAGKFIAVEIEKRISERMPSLDDLDARLTEYLVGILDSVDFHEWLLSRLTSSEKQNNSQKTEGGEE